MLGDTQQPRRSTLDAVAVAGVRGSGANAMAASGTAAAETPPPPPLPASLAPGSDASTSGGGGGGDNSMFGADMARRLLARASLPMQVSARAPAWAAPFDVLTNPSPLAISKRSRSFSV